MLTITKYRKEVELCNVHGKKGFHMPKSNFNEIFLFCKLIERLKTYIKNGLKTY